MGTILTCARNGAGSGASPWSALHCLPDSGGFSGRTRTANDEDIVSRAAPKTGICRYDATSIEVRGKDLCNDLIGNIGLVDYLYLLTFGTLPKPAHSNVIEACLVALAEHGLTPSAIAARLTYMGAPESFQGAVAAGLLGVGDQFVGTVENVAPLLLELAARPDQDVAATEIVARYRAAKQLVPGFGQPHHKPDDPRSPALFDVARRAGLSDTFVQALKHLGVAVDAAYGRHMTINAPATVAALFLEMGLPQKIMRGFIVVSRCVGIVAHLAEEQTAPVGRALWDGAAHAVDFDSATPMSNPGQRLGDQ